MDVVHSQLYVCMSMGVQPYGSAPEQIACSVSSNAPPTYPLGTDWEAVDPNVAMVTGVCTDNGYLYAIGQVILVFEGILFAYGYIRTLDIYQYLQLDSNSQNPVAILN